MHYKYPKVRTTGPYPSVKWSMELIQYIDTHTPEQLLNYGKIISKFYHATKTLKRAGLNPIRPLQVKK